MFSMKMAPKSSAFSHSPSMSRRKGTVRAARESRPRRAGQAAAACRPPAAAACSPLFPVKNNPQMTSFRWKTCRKRAQNEQIPDSPPTNPLLALADAPASGAALPTRTTRKAAVGAIQVARITRDAPVAAQLAPRRRDRDQRQRPRPAPASGPACAGYENTKLKSKRADINRYRDDARELREQRSVRPPRTASIPSAKSSGRPKIGLNGRGNGSIQ